MERSDLLPQIKRVALLVEEFKRTNQPHALGVTKRRELAQTLLKTLPHTPTSRQVAGVPEISSTQSALIATIDKIFDSIIDNGNDYVSHAYLARPLTQAIASFDYEQFFVKTFSSSPNFIDELIKIALLPGNRAEIDIIGKAASSYLSSESGNFQGLAETLEAEIKRRARRSSLIIARARDAENGRQQALMASQAASVVVNEAIAGFKIPARVADFLKGPWYRSLQLCYLKLGNGSNEWASSIAATQMLCDSMRPKDASSEDPSPSQDPESNEILATIDSLLLFYMHDESAKSSEIEILRWHLLKAASGSTSGLEFHQPIESPPYAYDSAHDPLASGLLVNGQWYYALNGGPLECGIHLLLTNRLSTSEIIFCDATGKETGAVGYRNCADLIHSKCLIKAELDELYSSNLEAITSGASELTTVEYARASAEFGSQGSATGSELDSELELDLDLDLDLSRDLGGSAIMDTGGTRGGDFASQRDILETGVWIGFHDTAPPLLARMAVYDETAKTYAFTNRDGILVRKLTREEFLALEERDDVVHFETHNNFKAKARAITSIDSIS
ncbi:hypothetical protein A3709_19825 [Halioglobus sp. HI00S01]|uniref:DUF1631 family protein n=1 Tax=Halioglobus sp. HI00S01 TaxID=1822214 RepID=UPI0007C338A3|nr:DUF1631 family protein [Halioglobus sp. HI00S01]KZX57875.1 hypothetical protein A3709_19825 [Halioglobus sp. HI00S01]